MLFAACLCGCDNNNEKMYSGDNTLYLNLSVTELDSIVCSFAGTSENRLVVNIPVEITGYASALDRTFGLRVIAENTTAVAGKHYEALPDEFVLKEGTFSVNIPVAVLYSPDLDKSTVRLALELVAGEGFSTGIPYRQRVTICISNQLPDVVLWAALYRPYFGEYSKVKHRYMLSELKLEKLEDSIDFYYSMDLKLWAAYGLHMNNFFAEHEINDEYGNLIEPWIK